MVWRCVLAVLILCGAVNEATVMAFELGKQVEKTLEIKTEDGNDSVHYLLYVPKSYGDGSKPFPTMLFLHGLGECGNGDYDKIKIHGPPKLVAAKEEFEFIVISPQCRPKEFKDVPTAWDPKQLIQLLDHVDASLNVDSTRTYATGLSMGGFGTWRLIAAFPERFAAAIPVCGGGDPKTASKISSLPIWCFHGADDNVVPLSLSEAMVHAVKESGGDAKLTVYPKTGHDSWTKTYDNREIYRWLLSHRRTK